MSSDLTAGEVATRLGVKASMVRRYAQALENVTGISLQVDPVRGRLFPAPAVELLEAGRAHLLAHPGGSVEGALRAVTGSAGELASPARVPGTITPDDLQTALSGVLAPVLAELEAQRVKADALAAEVQALRLQLAQLPSSEPNLSPVLDQVDSINTAMTQLTGTVLEVQQEQREQGEAQGNEVRLLRSEVAKLSSELQAARSTVERVEVITRAALPSSEPVPVPSGLFSWLVRLLKS